MDFDYEKVDKRKDNWPDTALCLPNDAACGEVDDYVTEDERSSERNEIDVTENEIRTRPASSRDVTSPLIELPDTAQDENDVTNELKDEELPSKGGAHMYISST